MSRRIGIALALAIAATAAIAGAYFLLQPQQDLALSSLRPNDLAEEDIEVRYAVSPESAGGGSMAQFHVRSASTLKPHWTQHTAAWEMRAPANPMAAEMRSENLPGANSTSTDLPSRTESTHGGGGAGPWTPPTPSVAEPASATIVVPVIAATDAATGRDQECKKNLASLGVVTQEPCADIEAIFKNLRTGRGLYKNPGRLFVDQTVPFMFVLETASGQEGESRLEAVPGALVKMPDVRFARHVIARLNAAPEDFSVTPSGDQRRTVTSAEPVQWIWHVTPKQAGERLLNLELLVEIVVNNRVASTVQAKVLSEKIIVEVTLLKLAMAYLNSWQGLLTAITGLIAAAGALYAAIRGLFRKSAGNSPTGG